MMKVNVMMMVVIAGLLGTQVASAQRLDLRFGHLERAASESVEVTLEKEMLTLASRFLSGQKAEERNIRELISGLTGIYVRSFTFDAANAYSTSDVDRVRSQLDRSWQRIVHVRSKKSDNVEIFVRPKSSNVFGGLVIIAAEPKELTVVQITGDIDLDRIAMLDGQLGIPNLQLESSGRSGGNRP